MRLSAYVFALIGVVITVPIAADAGAQGVAVATLGGTLAATPFVLVRAIEEALREADAGGDADTVQRRLDERA